MILTIDTTEADAVTVGLCQDDGTEVMSHRAEAATRHSQRLLAEIAAVIEEAGGGAPINQVVSAIEVNPGPGSFTGVRVGVSVANSLGLALGIPVNGRPVESWVAPTYAAPPNISQPHGRT